MASEANGKVVINEEVIGINGEKLSPKEIKITNKNESYLIDVESSLNNGVIEISLEDIKEGLSSIMLNYENEENTFQTQIIYMFQK